MMINPQQQLSENVNARCCRVCGSATLKGFLHLNQFPLHIGIVPRDKAASNPCWPLQATLCLKCGHCQQVSPPPESVLADLYSQDYSCHSPVLTGIGADTLDRFLEFLKTRLPVIPQQRVLEIGCYDGYVLDKLRNLGYEVEGCDPSPGADIAMDRLGLKVRKEFFRDGVYSEASFNVVIARHIIEHLYSPVEFLQSIARVLKPDGMVVLETPNYAHTLQHHLWGNFHLEHISFFTPSSLCLAMKLAGLIIADEYLGPYMYAIGKKGAENLEQKESEQSLNAELTDLQLLTDEFQDRATTFSENLRSLIKSIEAKRQSVAIYGAGGHTTTLWAMHLLDPSKIAYVVDGDYRKWGQIVSGLKIPVSPPERLCEEPVDYILLSSDLYEDDMLAIIRNRLRVQSNVIRLYPNVVVLNGTSA